MNTLLLDTNEWDLVADISGNIAVATDPYSMAQDAASAIRLFKGELYYDTTKGIPYWERILGKLPPLTLLKSQFVAAALTVPGVRTARCFISSFNHRTVAGQVQITDKNGFTQAASF